MKFSVTIPAYKARYLKEAVESVVAQTYQDWELIIVDDCSPENLRSIVEPFLNDHRIHYYRNERNCGAVNVVDNWNICLSYCTGEYVICMGDDDCLLPCCLEEYKYLITRHPQVNVIHGWTEIIDETGRVIALQQPRPERESALSLIWNRWNCREYQFIGDFCYKMAHLKEKSGYYKLPLAWGSDEITAVRAAMKNGIVNTQVYCFQYRMNDGSITSSNYAQIKIDATIQLYRWMKKYIDSIDIKQLNHIDINYYYNLGRVTKRHFEKIGNECSREMRGNPFMIYPLYRRLKIFGFPKRVYVKWYIKSLLEIFR